MSGEILFVGGDLSGMIVRLDAWLPCTYMRLTRNESGCDLSQDWESRLDITNEYTLVDVSTEQRPEQYVYSFAGYRP